MAHKMKRKFIWTTLFLSGFVLFLYFIANPNTKAWNFKRSDPGTISTASTQKTFYKWQDAQGNWHMSDHVPDGVKAQSVQVDTAANILQRVEIAKPSEPEKKSGVATIEPAAPGMPMTVNPADIPKLLEQAKGVQQLMDQRAQQVDKMR